MDNSDNLSHALWACLRDDQIEDIGISSAFGLSYFKGGRWQRSPLSNTDEKTAKFARDIAHHIAESAGVTLSARHPSLDTQLESFRGLASFRAHVVIPPLSGTGIHITLRRLGAAADRRALSDFGLSKIDEHSLAQAVRERASVLVCGPTGSGKTSLLKTLIESCDPRERWAILEDSAEISAPNALSFCLRSRNNRFESLEGSTWNLEQLVYESLRMRPDRIVLGECRGPEAMGLLHAIQSGHRGVMCTIHASTAAQAIERYKNLVQLAAKNTVQMDSATWDFVVVMGFDAHQRRSAEVYSTAQSPL